MVSKAPSFWWQRSGWQAFGLWPLSRLYGQIAGRRMARKVRPSVSVPVFCVGNFTVGGAGKTPTAIAIARAARARGLTPGFLSRGYGGHLRQTVLVDPARHGADAVGDEPLLLAREAMTVVSRRRLDGAKRLVAEGCDLIIMDDGFQSAQLVLDFALVVIDARRGIGNGHLVPAGPVRAPLSEQLRQMSALLKVGEGEGADPVVRLAARAAKPLRVASLVPRPDAAIAGQRVLAFAGIADPAKFYRTVAAIGGTVAAQRSFPDHHPFTEAELLDLIGAAERDSLVPVTTTKDAARLAGRKGAAERLLALARVVEVDMVFDDPHAPGLMIEEAIAHCRRRLLENGKG
ncbi:tetraacyldisaccharide 4'-kinase [Rhizobium straminoryzae]|uniref:Tetraacyldisaccharide 4'-kinase n=1 Tax=Rhizobium straminoryzae TaxID=1387186 RepID=A0A549TBK2_9HYPH|nr:tetraacyldisaccharide 4'-kinase [Rhizobium straminoryzae]TRL39277.1 tetraacyldisaccharide 4'-kinase [Rhizobium straminoryzae]